ncbi:MAG: hypothetical protein WDM89_20965 [Rhizomicrobium sp.]
MQKARIGWPADIVVLLFLLFATGVGSFFWHAFRTRLALAFDAIPGLLFLFVFTGVWIGRLFGRWAGVLGAFGLMIAATLSIMLSMWHSRLAHVAARAVVGASLCDDLGDRLFLVWATIRKIGWVSAQIVSLALVCAIIAAICRSIDLMMCSVIPFGTHFLWHILLSTAAYLAVVFLIRQRTRLA